MVLTFFGPALSGVEIKVHLIELSDYSIAATGSGSGLQNIYFALSDGDVCSIQTDSTDDAYIFLKALATLVSPENGSYRYMGETIDFTDYRKVLPFKKRIGYIGQDSAMISNKTIRENLLLLRSYFENSLSLALDEKTIRFCNIFNLQEKLDVRPGELRPVDLRVAIAIRELTKSIDVLLLERPEDYFYKDRFGLFNEILKGSLEHGQAIVFFSYDKNFIDAFSNRRILITGGKLTKVPN